MKIGRFRLFVYFRRWLHVDFGERRGGIQFDQSDELHP